MAEQRSIHEGMQRWLDYVREYHIDAWQYGQEQRLATIRGEWHGAVQEVVHVSELPGHFAALGGLTQRLAAGNDEHATMDVAIPDGAHLDYYAYEAAQHEDLRIEAELDRERVAAQDRLSDPDYAGEQAEQTFTEAYPNDDDEMLDVERPYATQYTGMLGSSPGRIEIDTSDTDMGGRWQDQLAVFEARLDLLAQEADMQHHIDRMEGMSY